MAHPDCGIQPQEAKELDNMMGVAGPPVVATKIIDIPSVMTDKEGRKFPTIMSNVMLVLSGRYNLFSMTKLMKDR